MTPPPEGEPPERWGGIFPLLTAVAIGLGLLQNCANQRREIGRKRMMEEIRAKQQEADVRPR